MPQAVYTRESLPGAASPGVWRGRILGATLFVFILALLLAAALLPITLPFRDRQLLTFTCEESGSIGLCERPDTVARFFVEMCGRSDVSLLIDQSRFRTGLDTDDLEAADFSLLCQPRVVYKEGIATLERTGSYIEQSVLSAALYESWRRGDLTAAEARAQLIATP